jgi:hypothetical protein
MYFTWVFFYKLSLALRDNTNASVGCKGNTIGGGCQEGKGDILQAGGLQYWNSTSGDAVLQKVV